MGWIAFPFLLSPLPVCRHPSPMLHPFPSLHSSFLPLSMQLRGLRRRCKLPAVHGVTATKWQKLAEPNTLGSSVFTCTGALGTPAERGPSLESIYRVSRTVDLCEGNKIISFNKFISPQSVGGPSERKKSWGPGHVPSVPIG